MNEVGFETSRCPHCATVLRIAPQMANGQTVDCPACRQSLLIQTLRGKPVVTVPELAKEPQAFSHQYSLKWLAVGGALLLVFAIGLSQFTGGKPEDEHPPQPRGVSQVELAPLDVPEASIVEFDQRLKGVFAESKRRIDSLNEFPIGDRPPSENVPWEDRWSWLAVMQGDTNFIGTDWNLRYDSPINDRFVRRSIPEYLNPSVETKAGTDGRPASHLAGITGIGPDSEQLPVGHPRAGLFGIGRTTRFDDVKDGLSQTAMVAGIDQRLRSWAAAGGTLRGLTTPTFVNGPDGFGNGNGESVFVLMADGSVREISAKAEAAAVFDLLTIDGGAHLPTNTENALQRLSAELNMSTPPANRATSPIPAGNSESRRPPLPPGIQLEETLGRRILRYHTGSPVPLEKVLFELAELAAVPLEYSPEIPEGIRKSEITFDLREKTVSQVFEQILTPLGLKMRPAEKKLVVELRELNSVESPP